MTMAGRPVAERRNDLLRAMASCPPEPVCPWPSAEDIAAAVAKDNADRLLGLGR